MNYEQTQCIDKVPDGYYVNDTQTNTIDECHPNCLTCNVYSSSDVDMKCLSCDNTKGYYFIYGTKNCEKIPYQGYYLDEEDKTLKKCYKDCLTCSAGPVANEKGVITNMNCDSCNELKSLFLIKGTKNCEVNKDIYADECPEEKPILKDGKCVLKYCTKEEYENKICTITNPVVKMQWIGDFPYVSALDKPLYSTFGQTSNDDILFETNIGNPFSERKIYNLNEKGRGFFDELPYDTIKLNSNLFSTDGIGSLLKINGKISYLRLSHHETLELYDLYDEKYTFSKLEDKLGYKVESSKNSLLKTKEENTFIYAYITTGNHLIMSKFKIVSNDAKDCLQIIKTSLEDFSTISKNSRRCIITESQYVECIDLNEDQIYVIRLYDSNLNFLKEYELEKNKAPKERAYYTYHEALWLKEDVSIFVYYNDVSDHNAKPIVLMKKIQNKNGKVELINASDYLKKTILFNTLPYIVSDSENSLARINEYYFALATVTSYQNSHIIITTLNIYNDDNSLVVDYFVLPWKDLQGINYHSNLQSFGYKNTLGIQFEQKKGNEYRSGFIIFGFGNSTDPEIINNIFSEKDSYILNPSKYIKIQHNIFCYTLMNVMVSEIPEASSGIVIKRNNDKKTVIKKGDLLSINEEVIITYTGNKENIPKGNYIVAFTPYLNEADADSHYKCATDEENLGQEVPTVWRPDEYYGRTFYFEFTIGKCFDNCMTCKIFGTGIDNQQCDTCIPDYYFVEGTKNCLEDSPEGYYLDEEEEIHKKCYESCKTCTNKKEKNTHNCITCNEGYTLFKNKNCLNCKSINKYINYDQTECIDEIPDGYYVNDTELNTLDKCHPNCLTCKSKGTDYDMKCTSCDKDNAYYFYLGSQNCKQMPMPGYYISNEDERIKKCDIACATCSYKPIYNEENEVTNCDTCNKDLGFYNKEPGSTICINKTKEGEYYDETCKCYKKCHENCLTCSGEAIDQYHMNCLTCDVTKGFEYFSKTSNCLNCKNINKKVNYEQTECIDDIPEGYYVNDTDSNIIESCHKNCLTCSKGPTDDNQNCLSCKQGLYLQNGNCVTTYNCPYKFYYKIKIDKNAYTTEKICLKKDEICPSSLPFYYTTTNECVESCPLDLLFYQGCKISNPNFGINLFIIIIRINFMQGLISSMSKSFSLYAFNNIYIKISILDIPIFRNIFSYRNLRNLQLKDDSNSPLYQSLTDDNTLINITDNFEGSDINLGDCEQKLREHYKIPDDVELTIIKLDYKRNDSKISQVQYEVFNPKNRSENLDLSICEKEKIKVINPIDFSSNKLSNIIPSSENNLQFSDLSESLYKDICSQFLSENGAYVLIQDRLLDYNYEKQYCQKGCTMQELNVTSGTVVCLCPPNNGFGNLSIDNIDDNVYQEENIDINIDTNKDKYNNQKYSYTNIKALQCVKGIFNTGFGKNYILIIYTLLLISYLSLIIKCLISYENIRGKLSKEEDIHRSQVTVQQKGEKKKKKTKKDNKESREQIEKKQEKKGEKGDQSNETMKKSIVIPVENVTYLDKMNFATAKKNYQDKKNSFLDMFLFSLKKREIIASFWNKFDNALILKTILLILSFINYLAVNTFFFSEKNIHQIYLDKNVYNFSYQFKYIIASFLISYVFLGVAKFFYNILRRVGFISNRYLLMISFIISSIIFIFYWMYIGAVTSLYINIKKHLIVNIILCFIFTIIFEVLLSLIYATCRIISIKIKNKTLYKINKFINYI